MLELVRRDLINLVVHLIQFNFEQNLVLRIFLLSTKNNSLQVNINTQINLFRYSGVCHIATALLASYFGSPSRAFNVNFVTLIASALTNKRISYKIRHAITRTPLYSS